jgi:hypothetical protein
LKYFGYFSQLHPLSGGYLSLNARIQHRLLASNQQQLGITFVVEHGINF